MLWSAAISFSKRVPSTFFPSGCSYLRDGFLPRRYRRGVFTSVGGRESLCLPQGIVTNEEVLGLPAHELLGESRDKWIAKELTLKGGGCPSDRTVRKTVTRCSKPDWYAGKVTGCKGGRPPTYTEAQKARVAQTAMALKRSLMKPTPSGVRAKLPRLSLNKETGEPMSKSTIYRAFVTRCYDETEDDPWVFMRRRRRRRRRRRPGRRRRLPTSICEKLSACRRYCLTWDFII